MNAPTNKRIAIVDCGKPAFVADAVIDLLKEDYQIELTNAYDADYVIHSCMGYDVLKYNGIRIFVCGECVSPDFNISDYALAFDRMVFGDRNNWFPLIKLYKDAYAALKSPRTLADETIKQKSGFCSYVMSNTKNSSPERVEIFDLLNAYKTVSSGGRWRNNVGGPVSDKLKFQSQHKFAIAFENNSHPGYLTEKFAQAAHSGAIPIYWGDPEIGKYFNSRAFINCHDYPSLDAAAARVIEVDQDETLYRQMLNEPWFPNNTEQEILSTHAIKAFLRNIFDQPQEEAYRRNRSRWGIKYEKNLRRMHAHPLKHGLHQLRATLRKKA